MYIVATASRRKLDQNKLASSYAKIGKSETKIKMKIDYDFVAQYNESLYQEERKNRKRPSRFRNRFAENEKPDPDNLDIFNTKDIQPPNPGANFFDESKDPLDDHNFLGNFGGDNPYFTEELKSQIIESNPEHPLSKSQDRKKYFANLKHNLVNFGSIVYSKNNSKRDSYASPKGSPLHKSDLSDSKIGTGSFKRKSPRASQSGLFVHEDINQIQSGSSSGEDVSDDAVSEDGTDESESSGSGSEDSREDKPPRNVGKGGGEGMEMQI